VYDIPWVAFFYCFCLFMYKFKYRFRAVYLKCVAFFTSVQFFTPITAILVKEKVILILLQKFALNLDHSFMRFEHRGLKGSPPGSKGFIPCLLIFWSVSCSWKIKWNYPLYVAQDLFPYSLKCTLQKKPLAPLVPKSAYICTVQ
jgi:hypothetical protein